MVSLSFFVKDHPSKTNANGGLGMKRKLRQKNVILQKISHNAGKTSKKMKTKKEDNTF